MYGQQHPQQQAGVPGGMGGARDPAVGRFLMPVADASFQFETVLDDLQRDAWPVPSDQRVARCTGVALQVCGAAGGGGLFVVLVVVVVVLWYISDGV